MKYVVDETFSTKNFLKPCTLKQKSATLKHVLQEGKIKFFMNNYHWVHF